MAHNDLEIEVKTPLTKKEFLRIKRKVSQLAQKIKTSDQKDTYFSPKIRSFLRPKYPYEWLSLRIRDGVTKLNYKHWYPEGARLTTHCDEYETVVDKGDQMEKTLHALNFEKLVIVKKKRLVYVYQDKFEIALDNVSSLGYFIEVEALRDLGGVEKTYQGLVNFLKLLGVKKIKVVPGGYAAELLRKKRLLKN